MDTFFQVFCRRIVVLHGNAILNFLKNFHVVFHSGYTYALIYPEHNHILPSLSQLTS